MKSFIQFLNERAVDDMFSSNDFKKMGEWINSVIKNDNYQVAPAAPAGKPAKNQKGVR
jgi:hypothetical protein